MKNKTSIELRAEFEKAFVKELNWAAFVALQSGTFRMDGGDYAIDEVRAAFRWFKVGLATAQNHEQSSTAGAAKGGAYNNDISDLAGQSQATKVPEPPYGATDFGFNYAGVELEEGDKRLASLIVKRFGSDHQAMRDLDSLIWRSRSLATPTAQEVTQQADYKQWYDAVTDACIVAGELPWDENDPRGTVAKLIAWHEEIALDPRVSERALALTQQAAKAETVEQAEGEQANVLPPTRGTDSQHDASALVAQPKLYARLMEMSGILRDGGRWTGNEFAFADKSESDVSMLDDILGDALRLAAEPPVAQGNVLPPFAAPAGQQDAGERAFNTLYSAIINIPCERTMSHFANRYDMMLYKEGHRDARHAAADLIAEAASGFREGRNAQSKGSDLAPTTSTVSAPKGKANSLNQADAEVKDGTVSASDEVRNAATDWQEADRIANEPSVDDALQGFSDDPTAENGVCVVIAVLDALRSTSTNKGEAA